MNGYITAAAVTSASTPIPIPALTNDQKQRIANNKAVAMAKLATKTAAAPTASAAAAAATPDCVTETKGDLFDGWNSVQGSSLGHCVSRCFSMSKGIAVEFKTRFGCVPSLKHQHPGVGGLAVLNAPTQEKAPARFVYYLVTKEVYHGKPTYDTITSSIQRMRTHAQQNGVKRLCLPRIGCGLDGLDWVKVLGILRASFHGSGISVCVYYV